MATYIASKSKSQERKGWSISFRHPLRTDTHGKPGLKMRRGLNTADEGKANALVAEMNEILADPSWWSALRRGDAEKRFDPSVVRAFFDEIQAGQEATAALRERHIPLPGREQGYSRVLFVGTTGAGKTSLLRKLIGSDPDRDRFPSTAPAKTTIADIEIIQAEGIYEGAVTFFSEFHVAANIEDCVADACEAAREQQPDARIAERLLNHRDQKFRLSYVLGSWDGESVDDDELSFDVDQPAAIVSTEVGLASEERAANSAALREYVARIRNIATTVAENLRAEIGDLPNGTEADRKAQEELIEETFDAFLNADEEFHDLVQDIVEAVRTRFEVIDGGSLELGASGWPTLWRFSTPDRDDFIAKIRFFSSNYWPRFGRLLTPLVDGMRLRGPLFPVFRKEACRLALIDGQGLGHTPDASSNLSTHVSKRFDEVDVVLLVDSAAQPMQAAPLSVLRALAAGGHHSKLAIAFTHFDQINAPSLRTFSDQRAHVMGSVTNALSHLRDAIGAPLVRDIERTVEQRCFMLGGVDRADERLPPKAAEYMAGQLRAMTDLFAEAILPPPVPEAKPIYDPSGIAFAVQEAVTKFQGPWFARLGLAAHAGVEKEHWTRIRALNRRIAAELDVEYDTLRPVADLVAMFREAISRFLESPIGWTRSPENDEEAQLAIGAIRRSIATTLHSIAVQRLVEQHLQEWRTAYDAPAFKGAGSTFRRARAIEQIYEAAAPVPDAAMTKVSADFLAQIRAILTKAIEDNGGEVRLATIAMA